MLESFSDRKDHLTNRFSYPDLTFTKEAFSQGAANGLKSITLLGSEITDIEYHDGAHRDSCILIQKQVLLDTPWGGLHHVLSPSTLRQRSLL